MSTEGLDGRSSRTAELSEGNLQALGATLLALMIAVGFLGNTFLVATVLSSSNLRSSIFNLTIIHLAFLNLLDIAINMFISLIYIAKGSWWDGPFADFVCSVNGALSILITLELLFGILFMSIDRALTLVSDPPALYAKRMTPIRAIVVLVLLWSIGFCTVVLPLLIPGIIETEMFPPRYFCAIARRSPVGFVISLAVIHLMGLVCLFITLVIIFHRARTLRDASRALLSQRLNDDAYVTDKNRIISNFRTLTNLIEPGKFTVIIFCVWFLLTGPYTILAGIDAIGKSAEMAGSLSDSELLQIPPAAETGLAWLKFLFPVTFPFITFGYRKGIWKKFKSLICCRKTNMIVATVERRRIAGDGGLDENGRLGGRRGRVGVGVVDGPVGFVRAGAGGGGGGGGHHLFSVIGTDDEIHNNRIHYDAVAPTLMPTAEGIYQRHTYLDQTGLVHENYALNDVNDDGTSDYGSYNGEVGGVDGDFEKRRQPDREDHEVIDGIRRTTLTASNHNRGYYYYDNDGKDEQMQLQSFTIPPFHPSAAQQIHQSATSQSEVGGRTARPSQERGRRRLTDDPLDAIVKDPSSSNDDVDGRKSLASSSHIRLDSQAAHQQQEGGPIEQLNVEILSQRGQNNTNADRRRRVRLPSMAATAQDDAIRFSSSTAAEEGWQQSREAEASPTSPTLSPTTSTGGSGIGGPQHIVKATVHRSQSAS